MSPTVRNLLLVGLGIFLAGLIALLVRYLIARKSDKNKTAIAPPTQVEKNAIEAANQALVDRAHAVAKSDEQKQKIADIEKIEDPAEKLKQLSEMMKSV